MTPVVSLSLSSCNDRNGRMMCRTNRNNFLRFNLLGLKCCFSGTPTFHFSGTLLCRALYKKLRFTFYGHAGISLVCVELSYLDENEPGRRGFEQVDGVSSPDGGVSSQVSQ